MTEATMNKDEVLSLLRVHKATQERRFGVTDIALFGSFARNQNVDHSDCASPPKLPAYLCGAGIR